MILGEVFFNLWILVAVFLKCLTSSNVYSIWHYGISNDVSIVLPRTNQEGPHVSRYIEQIKRSFTEQLQL